VRAGCTVTSAAPAIHASGWRACRARLSSWTPIKPRWPGGDDSTNLAYGDTVNMAGNARGGDDVLVGGSDASGLLRGEFNDFLFGDARQMSGRAQGGNDMLVSGPGNDHLWGDGQLMLDRAKGGNDTFVFDFNNGYDRIEDFGQGKSAFGSQWGADRIEVSALGARSIADLNISTFNAASHQSTITFGAGNEVVVVSQAALSSDDFIFLV
jgi:hypothetical protein